jgi:hypothetical protein
MTHIGTVRRGALVKLASLACEAGNADLVELLLKAGADANGTLSNGETPLMMAALRAACRSSKSSWLTAWMRDLASRLSFPETPTATPTKTAVAPAALAIPTDILSPGP